MPAVLRFLLVIGYVIACGVLVFVVLLQQGRGAGMGASLGGGASQTLFGSQASNFMTRLTAIMAGAFMILAMALSLWPPFGTDTSSDVDDILAPVEIEAPSAEAPPPDLLPGATPPETPAEEPAPAEQPVPVDAAAPPVEDEAAAATPEPAQAPELTPAEAAAAATEPVPAAP